MLSTVSCCSSHVVKPIFPTSASYFHIKTKVKHFNSNNNIIYDKNCSYFGLQFRSLRVACKARKDTEQLVDVQRDRILQASLWATEGAYILWLFLSPYAPGDPVWAIKKATIDALLGLSLNFFFFLPLVNSVGIHFIESPVLHPVSEGLFNFVIAWTLMFAPLLYTDYRRDRYKGSLDILWGFQMFLTNTFLIPYMAIRLNGSDADGASKKLSKLGEVMTKGSSAVGLIGGSVCLLSFWWAFFGRGNAGFGPLSDRWEFFMGYIGSERLAYAFIWDIVLYSIFQPWLIGDNLRNVEKSKVDLVSVLRFIPVVGLVVYLLSLDHDRLDFKRED